MAVLDTPQEITAADEKSNAIRSTLKHLYDAIESEDLSDVPILSRYAPDSERNRVKEVDKWLEVEFPSMPIGVKKHGILHIRARTRKRVTDYGMVCLALQAEAHKLLNAPTIPFYDCADPEAPVQIADTWLAFRLSDDDVMDHETIHDEILRYLFAWPREGVIQ